MWQKYFLFLVACTFLSCVEEETEPIDTFLGQRLSITTWGGSAEDIAHDIIETQDGGVAIFGNSMSTDGDLPKKNNADSDCWLLRLDSNDQKMWSLTFGGSDDDRGHSIVQTTDGGFVLVGYSKSKDGDLTSNQGMHDNWIVKIDKNGEIEWQKSFGYSGHDHAYAVIATSDGGFAMTGYIDVTASGGLGNAVQGAALHGVGEFWTHKLNAQGEVQWRRYHGGTNNDRSYDLVETEDGHLVITGTSESTDVDISNNHGSYDVWAIKIDSKGKLVWEKSFGGSAIDESAGILRMNDNSLRIVGTTFSDDGDVSQPLGQADLWVLAVSADGKLMWEQTYGGKAFDAGAGIHRGPGNTVFVTGNTKSVDGDLSKNKGNNDLWVLQLDNNGKILWQDALGGSGADFGYSLVFTEKNHLYVVGETISNDGDFPIGKGNKDAFVVKY